MRSYTEAECTEFVLFDCGHLNWAQHNNRPIRIGDKLFCVDCYSGHRPVAEAMRKVVGIAENAVAPKVRPVG